MRVETAVEEARARLAEGKLDEARAILADFADHPKAQYWISRIDKSEDAAFEGEIATDRMFTFGWNTVIAVGIIGIFALVIIIIGLSA